MKAPVMNDDQSIRALLGRAFDDVSGLMRQELRLAQAEVTEKLMAAQPRVIGILAGLLLAFCGVLTLVQALVIGLSEFMPAWLASGLTGIVLLVVALFLIKRNQAELTAAALKPRRALRALKRDKDMIMEHAP